MNRREAFSSSVDQISITEYRPFIDGLRAISIIFVVAYHVDASLIPGGFIGVDVFFVISGFLIINQIIDGLKNGRFSFADFWSRRALRILPAYFLVLGTSIAIAQFVLVTPEEIRQFGHEVAWSSIFGSNILYLMQQGYFDSSSDTKVLLNLWSLAVEEQFYIVAPLIILALWAIRGKGAFAVTATLFFLSLAGCILLTLPDKNYGFYLMPLRAWEFIAGGAIAFLAPHALRLPRALLEMIGALGVAAIALSAFYLSRNYPFPSFYATLPAFGAAAVILAGVAAPGITIARMLSLRPMIWIGLVSYAWYLWHWPLLTFGRIYNFGDHILWFDILMATLSLLLAVATRFAIEKPVLAWRRRRYQRLPWKPAIIGLITCILVTAAGGLGLDSRASHIAAATPPEMLPSRNGYVRCDLNHISDLSVCDEGDEDPRLGLLWGDSQAASALAVLSKFASDHGARLASFTSGGCPPLYGIEIVRTSPNCTSYRANGIPHLDHLSVDFAILYARWPLYGTGTRSYSLASSNRGELDQDTIFVEGLRSAITKLTSMGAQRILVIGPTPLFPRVPPVCYARSLKYGLDPDQRCSSLRRDQEADRHIAMTRIAEALAGQTNVHFLDPFDAFCDDVYCRPFDQTGILFNDTNHISDYGVEKLIATEEDAFSWVFGDSQ